MSNPSETSNYNFCIPLLVYIHYLGFIPPAGIALKTLAGVMSLASSEIDQSMVIKPLCYFSACFSFTKLEYHHQTELSPLCLDYILCPIFRAKNCHYQVY